MSELHDENSVTASDVSAVMKEIGAEGGRARAAKLTPEQRSEIAKRAADARWTQHKATHEGILRIGCIEIPCANLDNGVRVLTQSGFMVALGRARQAKGRQYYDGDVNMPAFLTAKNLKPFIPEDLTVTSSQIEFRTLSGKKAFGYAAELLPKVCYVFLDAKENLKLTKGQEHIANQAKILIRGLAHVGIIALVDEATGFQDVRDRLALQEILDRYLRKEFAAWARSFPDSFYREIFRLRNWEWRGMKINRPQCVAAYTKDLVYARLAPGILKELEAKNPKLETGRRKNPHYYWLTEDVGHPALAQHLHAVVGLMKAADNWEQFKRMIDRSFPRRGDSLQLELFNRDE